MAAPVKRFTSKRWYKLDNAGKLYPAVAIPGWNYSFRLAAVLKQEINVENLQTAVDHVLARFPAMAVRMRIGFFWYYLEENTAQLLIQQDTNQPCKPFHKSENNGHLLRILYGNNRISVEFFHAITDGGGGMVFLKTLLAEYLRLCGVQVPVADGILDLAEEPSPGETEDAFLHVPVPSTKLGRKESLAYHFPGEMESPLTLHVISASMPMEAVKEKAKLAGVTINEYLVSAMIYVGYQAQLEEGKKHMHPVRVTVPINMRRFFETNTLRNFSWFVNPGIDPVLGDYTFSEVLQEVHVFMQHAMTPKHLFAGIAANVSNERNMLMRLAPLPLKDLAIIAAYRALGDRVVTTTLSNLGPVKVPEQILKNIVRFEFLLGPASIAMTDSALVTTGENMQLSFTSNQCHSIFPLRFFRFLMEQGIPITIIGGAD